MSYDLAVIYRGGPYLVRSFVNVAGSCDYSFVRQKNDEQIGDHADNNGSCPDSN